MIAAAALLYLALFLIAAGTAKHGPLLLGKALFAEHGSILPRLGWIVLTLSLLPVALAPRWPYALMEWIGLGALLSGAILLSLTYDIRAARFGTAVAIAGLGLALIV